MKKTKKEIVTVDARNRIVIEYDKTSDSFSVTEYQYNQGHDLWLPLKGYVVTSAVFDAMLKIKPQPPEDAE